jgi:hypothetical protein
VCSFERHDHVPAADTYTAQTLLGKLSGLLVLKNCKLECSILSRAGSGSWAGLTRSKSSNSVYLTWISLRLRTYVESDAVAGHTAATWVCWCTAASKASQVLRAADCSTASRK